MGPTYTADELLSSDPVVEPLVLGGIRCHGGFDASGSYVPPRTKVRAPAIVAWQQAQREAFGTELLDAPIDLWPPQHPSVEQSKMLLRAGVAEPTITSLTRIGTVEGFGGMIRHVSPGSLERFFVEPIDGTTLAHLDGGLFEAHARDEAGHDDEGGHRDMWFAARDIAFEKPLSEDETERMMTRMGIQGPGGAPGRLAQTDAVFPALDPTLEAMLRRMIGLLFIEVSAFHTFSWAEELLDDRELAAGDGEAARIVSYIREDEITHVEYLRTALTEMRDRTFKAADGGHLAGAEVINTLWDLHLRDSLGPRRAEAVRLFETELEHSLDGNPRRAEILSDFHALDGPATGEAAAP